MIILVAIIFFHSLWRPKRSQLGALVGFDNKNTREGLIVRRIFASKIWEDYFWGAVIFGGAYYWNFTCYIAPVTYCVIYLFAEELEKAKNEYTKVKEELDATMQELNEM